MDTLASEASIQRYARVAGASYLITMALGIFGVTVVGNRLVLPADHPATVQNLLNHEHLYRLTVASEVLMYALVVLLALSLYLVLRPVNPRLALLALLWRLAEAIIGGSVTVVSGLIPLLLLQSGSALPLQTQQDLVGMFLSVRGAGLDVVLIFIGLGGTVFCYLFYVSRCVPRVLAIWGLLTYVSMLMISFLGILLPDFPESVTLAFFAPGGLFEILFGFWLLLKGVNLKVLRPEGPAVAGA